MSVRIPHQEFLNLHSIVPGSPIIVVEELRSGDDTEDVVRTDLTSGKVLNRWHYPHLLSWISSDGIWATTYDREAIHLPTQRIVGKLEYVPATVHSVPWNVDYGCLAARILKKEASVYLVITLFLLLGGMGYLLCSVSKFSLLAYLASALTLTVWWFRELWWPLHGPPISSALGAVPVTLTVLSIAVAYVLPIWATFGARPAWKSSPRMLRCLWWGLPLIAACLAGLLACVSTAQSAVEKERYQVEGDIRAGGELRGSGLVAWYERNLPYESASAIWASISDFQLPSRTQRTCGSHCDNRCRFRFLAANHCGVVPSTPRQMASAHAACQHAGSNRAWLGSDVDFSLYVQPHFSSLYASVFVATSPSLDLLHRRNCDLGSRRCEA